MVTSKIVLNLETSGISPRVYLSQYDADSRQIEATLFNGDEAYEVPAGTSVSLSGVKPDGTIFDVECTYSGSVVTIPVIDAMTVVAGVVTCELTIYEGSTFILSSKNLYLMIETAAVDIHKISEDSLKGLQEIRRDAVDAAQSATNSANAALTYKNAAEASATNAAASATSAAASELNADFSKNEAGLSAANAATSEMNAETSATQAAGYADRSESYAKGGTGTRSGEDTDNALYYKNQAAGSATVAGASAQNAATSATQAAGYADRSESYAKGGTGTRSGENTDNALYYKNQAQNSASTAQTSAGASAESATESESYAKGGTGTRSGEDTDNALYYKNQASSSAIESESYAKGSTGTRQGEDTDNAMFYSDSAQASAGLAGTSAGNASLSAIAAADSAKESESYAKGGTGTRSGEDTDNALYYKNQASGSATAAATSAANSQEQAERAKYYADFIIIGYTDKGDYDPDAVYDRNDLVHYADKLWRCLIDGTTGITPATGANWAEFIRTATDASQISVTDTYGIVGQAGSPMDMQTLMDGIADITAANRDFLANFGIVNGALIVKYNSGE